MPAASSSLYPEIQLETIRDSDNGRTVAYSTVGPEGAPCALFFYPGGGNRRMLASLYKSMPHLRLVCVNRPGKGETSPAPKGASHVETTIQDALLVLDTLRVDQVSLLCMCAGTPFALAFATQEPSRVKGIMGISSFVLPADCGYENTKVTFYLGSRMPFVSPLVGSVMSSMVFSITQLPMSWVMKAFRKKLSEDERKEFDTKYQDQDEFAFQMGWIQQERGGQNQDMAVLLRPGEMIDYDKIGKTQKVTFWHGTKDSLVPYSSIEWLAEHIPGATLNAIQDGTHDGGLFLLHKEIVDSLKSFGLDDK